ncbi:recombinase family protein [Nocardioides sp. CFH 31398]|uniref:recombinase family protein n=1 Tax=Nocardioides sp. CFH 31398 TaxID=2919579 RepID=UPI001F06F18D|nr:recombinase family protein [Nocardioides sp. CFH 31398]MCH1867059.1 recombinase family protein [Nocardioides sp. CFH 31398]
MPTQGAGRRAVVYLRVSTDAQVEAWGFDVQEQAVHAYAATHDLEVTVSHRDEGVSGAKPAADRPGLMRALSTLRDGDADVLLVARLDRLARDLTVQEAVLAEVWSLDGEVHACDLGPVLRDDPSDPMRTAIRQVMGTFAQLDRALLVKRLRDGREAKRAAGGKPSGSYPFGQTRTGVDDREQHVISVIATLHRDGHTLDAIARHLNSRPGHQPRHATRWTRQTVGGVLRNRATAGRG